MTDVLKSDSLCQSSLEQICPVLMFVCLNVSTLVPEGNISCTKAQ